jgi:predicted nucleic acid-binding protein
MVIDTNILIYYLNEQLPESVKTQVDNAILSGCTISIITRIEVLGWQGHTEQSLIAARALLSLFEEISLNPIIADCCIELRKTYKIKLPDAIIAATALVQEKTLMSRNEDDFIKIAGLCLFNPFS